ncbi:MAG: class I SAM-dependent methyltransferase [Nitrospirae bacterium]|nr:class I SAM-dependent methyltransferase [Nitrospirota bacterium]
MVFQEEYAGAYDALYQDKDYEKECDYLEALFKKYDYRPKTILDLGCGTGGHALILARRGYHVAGVDRSAAMLAIAKKKAVDQRLDIEFIEGDLTRISTSKKYDAVMSLFAVMGYQTTNVALAAACKVANDCLVPGGIFMFDCWHGNAVITDKPVPRIKEIDSGSGEKIIRFTLPEIDEMNHVMQVNFRVWHTNGNEFTETSESHPMRFFFPQEIRYFLEVAGFKAVDLYPFLKLDTPLTDKDWNMMAVVR